MSVSVVIATCDRLDMLCRCLDAVVPQLPPGGEVVVVVNRADQVASTRRALERFDHVRLIDEPRPGLSFARNAGVRAAVHPLLAFTDDDTVPRADWLEQLLRPFADPVVQAVTGDVQPLTLDTPGARMFEAYGGLGRGPEPARYDADWFRSFRRHAVPTWDIGATANAAFRAALFVDRRIGPLDEALGAGTPTGCSEDTYAFYRILRAGGTIVYEPAAVVDHEHRDTEDALRRQVYAYSKGHVAYHLTTLVRDRDLRGAHRLVVELPAHAVRQVLALTRGRASTPPIVWTEIRGWTAGPWAWVRSLRRARRLRSAGAGGGSVR
ncbi:MAG: glycosyltransferase [Acidimicrobiales bacterium]